MHILIRARKKTAFLYITVLYHEEISYFKGSKRRGEREG